MACTVRWPGGRRWPDYTVPNAAEERPTGTQWLDSVNGCDFFEDKWLEFPAGHGADVEIEWKPIRRDQMWVICGRITGQPGEQIFGMAVSG